MVRGGMPGMQHFGMPRQGAVDILLADADSFLAAVGCSLQADFSRCHL